MINVTFMCIEALAALDAYVPDTERRERSIEPEHGAACKFAQYVGGNDASAGRAISDD